MKVLLMLDGRTEAGGAPLIMHNEQLADPLNDFTRQIAKVSQKRKKTDAEYLELGHLEFLGGLYTNGNGPCLPAFNVLRCLQDGAKRTKRGADVLRGVTPLVQHVDIAYDGPRDAEEMWKAGGFALRKAVGIKQARTMRTRPIFHDWTAVIPVEVDATVFDPDTLANIWHDAGRYSGMGDMRPIYGRFKGTLTAWPLRTEDKMGEAAFALACAVRCKQIQIDDQDREDRNGSIAAILEGAIAKAKKLASKI